MNYTQTSRYLPGCDGTKLAVDLYRPDVHEKVPLLLKAGTLLRTGPTRTNVMDMVIVLVRPK